MNDSVYAFDGSPSVPTSWPLTTPCTQLDHINLLTQLGTGEVPPLCSALGATNCQTIAPNVGILSTPVIKPNTGGSTTTGTLYLVAESVNNSTTTYYHRLWTLDITNLQTTSNYQINPTSCSNEQGSFSQLHLQRPALLLGGDNYLYVAFSMMDGNPPPLPNGMILAYNTASLTTPLCLAISQGTLNNDGGGIWGGAGGPAYGTDANTIGGSGNGKYYTFFNTANGQFGTNSNYGDSFIKMYNTGTALQINDYFSPGDQYYRSNKSCNGSDGDTDFGSGAPMLIPDGENTTWPTLAVSGDKEGGIWFIDRTIPEQGGSTSCPANSNTNVQTFQITSSFPNGPLIHTNPAFWENSATTNYLFVGSANDGTPHAGRLMRYQICGTGNPISSTSPCNQTQAAAYERVATSPLDFKWGTTPSISATSIVGYPGDAILWAILADGSVVPTQSQFYWMHNNKQINFNAAQNGVLYAFDAANPIDTGMKKLFGSSDCMIGGHLVDQMNPATKYSIPTVANGYVYAGTQGPLKDPVNDCNPQKNPTASCFMSGTFYIFGYFINPKPCS